MLKPIQKTNVCDVAFEQLRDRILDGTFAVGNRLPAERKLCDMLGVSRSAIRESLKKLEQSGLIESKHGSGAVVRDYKKSASTDLLVHLLWKDDQIDKKVARSIMELRSALAIDIARRCAQRDVSTDELFAIVDTMETEAIDDRVESNRLFWERLVDLTDNIAYRLTFNSVNELYETTGFLIAVVIEPELERVDLHRAIVDAIKSHDPLRAADAARDLLALGEVRVTQLLEQL